MEIFTEMESEIEKMFEGIIESAKKRKSEFLEELYEFKKRFIKKRDEAMTSIQVLEEKANKILAVNVESERAVKILQNRLESINSEVEELRKNTQIPPYRIDTTETNDIISSVLVLGSITTTKTTITETEVGDEKIYYTPMDSIDNFHEVKRKVPPILPPKNNIYSSLSLSQERSQPYEVVSEIYTDIVDQPNAVVEKPKNLLMKTFLQAKKLPSKSFEGRKKPILMFGKRGYNIGQLTQPRGIYFEEATQNIFVVSKELRKVCIFNLTGAFIAEFGQDVLEGPSCVTSHVGICYVTDEKLNGIYKFRGNDWKLVNKINFTRGSKEGMFKSLKGIAVDKNNLYIVDTGNNQVSVLGPNLVIKNVSFGDGILQQPQDIAVKDVVYVLDLEVSSCVHVFTKEGEHIRSLVNTTDIIGCIPNYFSVANDGGIILSILNGNNPIVFSKEGEFVYEIGGKKGSKEMLTNIQGVCITSDNRVVCAFAEGINCICIY